VPLITHICASNVPTKLTSVQLEAYTHVHISLLNQKQPPLSNGSQNVWFTPCKWAV